jgi:hypothetical protein
MMNLLLGIHVMESESARDHQLSELILRKIVMAAVLKICGWIDNSSQHNSDVKRITVNNACRILKSCSTFFFVRFSFSASQLHDHAAVELLNLGTSSSGRIQGFIKTPNCFFICPKDQEWSIDAIFLFD